MHRSKFVLAAIVAAIAAPSAAQAGETASRLSATPKVVAFYEDNERGYLGGGLSGTEMLARLTDASGAPIAARTIGFEVSGTLACSDLTDDDGFASCGSNRGQYVAIFEGDDVYAPSRGEGCLIGSTGSLHACALSQDSLFWFWLD